MAWRGAVQLRLCWVSDHTADHVLLAHAPGPPFDADGLTLKMTSVFESPACEANPTMLQFSPPLHLSLPLPVLGPNEDSWLVPHTARYCLAPVVSVSATGERNMSPAAVLCMSQRPGTWYHTLAEATAEGEER